MARSCHCGISGASDGFAGSYRFAQFPQRRELTSCEPVNLVAAFAARNDTREREKERDRGRNEEGREERERAARIFRQDQRGARERERE